MSNMTKQIIKVASEIAQNVSKNMRIANDADGAGCRELDFLNMENRAFRAAVEVLSNHPLLAPDFAPITVDLGLFPPKPADHPKAFPVFCGDVVKFGANHPEIDGFTVGKLYEVVGTSFDMITTTCNGEDYIDHYRHQFFSRFDPAPQPAPVDMPLASADTPDARDFVNSLYYSKEEIEGGAFDKMKAWPQSCNVWLSPVDGRPHFVDEDGWIHARGYMPVDGSSQIEHPDLDRGVLRSANWFRWDGAYPIVKFKLA